MSGRPLAVGDRLKDNDPRMPDRFLTITALAKPEQGDNRVAAITDAGVAVKIQTRRIHSDGKPRNSGFNLVTA